VVTGQPNVRTRRRLDRVIVKIVERVKKIVRNGAIKVVKTARRQQKTARKTDRILLMINMMITGMITVTMVTVEEFTWVLPYRQST
jgi:hypothetical protein